MTPVEPALAPVESVEPVEPVESVESVDPVEPAEYKLSVENSFRSREDLVDAE